MKTDPTPSGEPSWARRIACSIGIHTEGIRTAGCMHNIHHCRHCGRDVWLVLKDTGLDAVKATEAPPTFLVTEDLFNADQMHAHGQQCAATRDAEVARLTADRDSWEQQASERVNDALQFAQQRDEALAEVARLKAQVEGLRKDAERWRTFLATRPPATHEVINAAIDAALQQGERT